MIQILFTLAVLVGWRGALVLASMLALAAVFGGVCLLVRWLLRSDPSYSTAHWVAEVLSDAIVSMLF